jgi:hypothetical protein
MGEVVVEDVLFQLGIVWQEGQAFQTQTAFCATLGFSQTPLPPQLLHRFQLSVTKSCLYCHKLRLEGPNCSQN